MHPPMRVAKNKGNRRWRLLLLLVCLGLGTWPIYLLPAVTVAQPANNPKARADWWLQQGIKQYQKGEYDRAIDTLNKALTLYRSVRDRRGEGSTLMWLGGAHYDTSYDRSIAYYQRAIGIFQRLKDPKQEAEVREHLGFKAFLAIRQAEDRETAGNYAEAFNLLQKALTTYRWLQDEKSRWGEADAMNSLAGLYSSLGQHQTALSYYEQALTIVNQTNKKFYQAATLANIAIAHYHLGNYQQAIATHQQALQTYEQLPTTDPSVAPVSLDGARAVSLRNLGQAYHRLGQYQAALASYRQAQPLLATSMPSRAAEASLLADLGSTHLALAEYETAFDYFQQGLRLVQERKNFPVVEADLLSRVGSLFALKDQPELAIVFYKQAVNLNEEIRQTTRSLSRDLQESYLQTVAETYRTLASLLLAQGRVLEAQQVLELLKLQELRDYTREARNALASGTPPLPLNALESPVTDPFHTLISLGLRLTTCESQTPRCPDRDQLRAQRQAATEQFDQQAERLRRLMRQQDNQDPAQLQQQELTVAAAKIVQAHPRAVLIYPLVLEDKLWLVYGLQAGKAGVVFASKEVAVTRQELAAAVSQFRTLLENPRSDRAQLQQVSQKLYGWLIAPLRSQLDANQIQTLVFSLDRSTRYMPLAALFDGKQYLAERFTLSTILTAGLTDTSDKLSPNPRDTSVLGLGLSNPVPGFSPLPNVPKEIDAIVRSQDSDPRGIFQGSAYLNQDFTLKAFNNLIDYRILHIATHGKFVSEDPEQSFLLLGDGKPLRVPDIRKLADLGNIHLAVLSACETAKGGQDREGIEVAGLSYYFLTQNVKSVLASLWLVNDASTALMMQRFYHHLATGKLTKPEALRQAQLDLLRGDLKATDSSGRSDIIPVTPIIASGRGSTTPGFSHPYYWAPFILIGNSL